LSNNLQFLVILDIEFYIHVSNEMLFAYYIAYRAVRLCPQAMTYFMSSGYDYLMSSGYDYLVSSGYDLSYVLRLMAD